MDAAAKPPGMGLRRLPPPDPPRHPTECPLLTLLLLQLLPLRVQGAALPINPSQYSVRSGAPAGGGVYWYSQVSVRVLPPLRRNRRISICSVLPSGGTRSNIAR